MRFCFFCLVVSSILIWTFLFTSVSAASQAITFFIRTHLTRCEEQNDFPVLMRLTLSGTEKDDALLPALYSRTGGNVSNKDKNICDENGNTKERLTCFRRGTTVWYLSKVAGAPCPFARAGIALRDFAEGSAISTIEGRKGDEVKCGIKRKRERTSSRRVLGQSPEDEEPVEGQKPPKIKLTLRLRPCLTSLREKPEEADSSSSDSEAESNAQESAMDTDSPRVEKQMSSPSSVEVKRNETTWTFPPFPLQKQISIPPYTPVEGTFRNMHTSLPGTSPSAYFSEWPETKPRLELACVDTRPFVCNNAFGSYQRDRAPSAAFSVASPPPDSEDEFSIGDDDEDITSLSMSPEVKWEHEGDFAYEWPQAAPSSSSLDLNVVKIEPEEEQLPSKRSSTQTLMHVKSEDIDLNLDGLSLSIDDGFDDLMAHDVLVKGEEDTLCVKKEGADWSSIVDLTADDGASNAPEEPALRSLWKDDTTFHCQICQVFDGHRSVIL
jgi:hypothetical protein